MPFRCRSVQRPLEVFMLETVVTTQTVDLPFSYGFDDVALVPGIETLDPELCDLSWAIGKHSFDLPILAAAMDGVVSPGFSAQFHRQGGLAVINGEGLHARYEDPSSIYRRVAEAAPEDAPALLQAVY